MRIYYVTEFTSAPLWLECCYICLYVISIECDKKMVLLKKQENPETGSDKKWRENYNKKIIKKNQKKKKSNIQT